MDVICEHLVYKDVPITICMKNLKPIEHYQVVRLILASHSKSVSICKHNSTNSYIDKLLENLPVHVVDCSTASGAGSSTTFGSVMGSGTGSGTS